VNSLRIMNGIRPEPIIRPYRIYTR
jgi:hypothetical protein